MIDRLHRRRDVLMDDGEIIGSETYDSKKKNRGRRTSVERGKKSCRRQTRERIRRRINAIVVSVYCVLPVDDIWREERTRTALPVIISARNDNVGERFENSPVRPETFFCENYPAAKMTRIGRFQMSRAPSVRVKFRDSKIRNYDSSTRN